MAWSKTQEKHQQLVEDIVAVSKIINPSERMKRALSIIAARVATHAPRVEWCCTCAMAALHPSAFDHESGHPGEEE